MQAGKTILAILLLFGAAAWTVFVPSEIKDAVYLAVWQFGPVVGLIALGIAVVVKRG